MITDVNISWGNWPFQSFRFATPSEMKDFLKKNGISGGLVRSAEAAFSPDLEECNRKLFSEFDGKDGFIPVPTVNPYYSEWMKLLDSRNFPVFAIYPSFHDYSVLSEEFTELAGAVAVKSGVLLIVVRQEDERGHHKLCKVPAVPVSEINILARKFPALKIIALNCYFGEIKILLDGVTNVFSDIAFAETHNTISAILEFADPGQIVFGSHTPFLYTAASLMKFKDAVVGEKITRSISSENAERILKCKQL